MKASKKILIAVIAVILVAAIVLGVGYIVLSKKVPALNEDAEGMSDFSTRTTYTVVKAPYIQSGVMETRTGIQDFWTQNKYSYGVELVLQCTADDELVVLSEPLPGLSNAESVLGKDVSVSGNTLSKLQKVNLLYNYTDADGKTPYRDYGKSELSQVTILSLDELLYYFSSPVHYTSMLFFRFLDESAVQDMNAMLEKLSQLLVRHGCALSSVFCPQSDATAAYIDSSCPDLMRTATESEMRKLYLGCLLNKSQGDLPYVVVTADKDSRYGSEKFIHYARNLGLAVVLDNVTEDEILTYRSRGTTALLTADGESFNQVLSDARKADQIARREAKKAAAQ